MDDDDQIIFEERVIIEEDEEVMEEEPAVERKVRETNDDDVLQVRVEQDELELKDGEEASLEDGEVEEKKQKELRVHLPDLLQGINNDDDIPQTNSENLERLKRRAKRFAVNVNITSEDINKVLLSLEIPLDEREATTRGRYKLDHLEMFGVFSLSNDEIAEYFEDYNPLEIREASDDAVFVKFSSDISAFRALNEKSKPIGEPRKEERIIKHVLTADDSSPERKVITKDNSEEFDKTVHPDDIQIEMPEGKWRYGTQHKKCQAILLRFPLKSAFRQGHYLNNDRYYQRQPRNVEPPPEAVEMEREERERSKNFDKKNPWADLSHDWARAGKNDRGREYELPIESLDRPPIRLADGRRDWDDPSEPDHPVQIRPMVSRKRKFESDEEEEEAVTYYSPHEISSGEQSEEDKDEIDFRSKLKKPRLGMVADMEEKKQKMGVKGRLKGVKKAKEMIPNLKRRVKNSYVVSEKVEIISGDEDEDELDDPHLVAEAQDDDLRHQLTMRVENKPHRPILKPTRKLADRFGDMERQVSDGEDRNYKFENMKIEIRKSDESSDDERMDVDEPMDARTRLKMRKEARERGEKSKKSNVGDLRERMSRDRRSENHEVRTRSPEDLRKRMTKSRAVPVKVKDEHEEERRKEESRKVRDKTKGSLDDERKDIEEQIEELKNVKAEEKELLDKLNNKLKRMEQEKEDMRKMRDAKERLARDKTRRAEPVRDDRRRRREKSRDRERERDRQREREKDRRKQRQQQRTSRRRRRSPSSSDSDSEYSSSSSSDSDDSSSESSSSDSDSSSSSSSDDDRSSSSSSSDSDSSSDDSSPDRKKKQKNKSSGSKRNDAGKTSAKSSGKSSKPSSAKASNGKADDKKSSSKKDSDKAAAKTDDRKKDADLKAKLENFVNKSKNKKDKK